MGLSGGGGGLHKKVLGILSLRACHDEATTNVGEVTMSTVIRHTFGQVLLELYTFGYLHVFPHRGHNCSDWEVVESVVTVTKMNLDNFATSNFYVESLNGLTNFFGCSCSKPRQSHWEKIGVGGKVCVELGPLFELRQVVVGMMFAHPNGDNLPGLVVITNLIVDGELWTD